MRSKFLAAVLLVVAMGLSVSGLAFAMPSSTDSDTAHMTKLMPEWASLPITLGFGATGDYVIDRKLDDGSALSDTSWYGGNVYWDPLDNVHLSAFVGAANFRVGSVRINSDTTTKVELTTDTTFAGGGDAKVDVWQFPAFGNKHDVNMYATGGYRHGGQANVNQIHAGFDARAFDLQVEISEWHAGGGISQQWDNPLDWFGWTWLKFSAIPYVGCEYSDMDVNISGNSSMPSNEVFPTRQVKTGHLNSDTKVAVVTGLQLLTFNNTWSVDVEGRFVAETAVSVSGHVRW